MTETQAYFTGLLIYGVAQKLAHFVLYALTSSNIDRFSNLFHIQNQENICHQRSHHTSSGSLHYLVSQKSTVENETTSVKTHFKSAYSSSN